MTEVICDSVQLLGSKAVEEKQDNPEVEEVYEEEEYVELPESELGITDDDLPFS